LRWLRRAIAVPAVARNKNNLTFARFVFNMKMRRSLLCSYFCEVCVRFCQSGVRVICSNNVSSLLHFFYLYITLEWCIPDDFVLCAVCGVLELKPSLLSIIFWRILKAVVRRFDETILVVCNHCRNLKTSSLNAAFDSCHSWELLPTTFGLFSTVEISIDFSSKISYARDGRLRS